MTPLVRWLAQGMFAAILRLYPRHFRLRYGDEMQAALGQRLRRADGSLGTVRRAGADLRGAVAGLVAERLHPRAAHVPSPLPRDSMLTTSFADLRHSVRALRLAPGFTAAAVITLGLGIGMNTAIFSVIQAVLLRPLPYEQPQRLVALRATFQEQSWWSAALADVLEWRELSDTLEQVAFGIGTSLAVQGEGLPEQVPGVRVSANWFDTLGAKPLHGRGFVAGEDSPAADHVAVLTHGYWANRLAAAPDVVGSVLHINGNETTVVGVLPESYRADFLGNPQIYITRRFTFDDAAERVRIYLPIARVRDGVGLEAAQADMQRVAATVAERFPDSMEGWSVGVQPLHEAVTGGQRDLLVVLLAAVGLVLLVACANVSNLTLARATRQRRELAVRSALGAGRWRLVRQRLAESTVLAVAGGSVGLVLAAWGTDALLAQAPATIPRLDQAGIDPVVLSFTLAVSLLTGCAFGLLPALRSSRAEPQTVLRNEDTRTGSGAGMGARGLLVAAELALVVTLLVGAGVTLRAFQALQRTDLGFDTADKLVVPVTLPTNFQYEEIDEIARFFDELQRQLAASPQVAAAADISIPPLFGGDGQTGFHIIEGRDHEAGAEPTGGVEIISPGYFELMGMRILEGRGLKALDQRDARPVVVVNDAMARAYWGDASPLGARIRLGTADSGPFAGQWREVVGVVRGIRYGAHREIRPRLYVPDAQMPAPFNFRAVVVAPRGGDPANLAPLVRETVASIRPAQPIGTPVTFDRLAEGSLSTSRLQSLLLTLFGLVALALGAVGVYGVVAYGVGQRTREMGIRMALGASRRDVLGLVLRAAMAPVLAGTAVGLVAALGLGRVLESLVPQATALDPLVFVVVPAALGVTAVLASWLPARRATAVDPVDSLRAE